MSYLLRINIIGYVNYLKQTKPAIIYVYTDVLYKHSLYTKCIGNIDDV